MKRQLGSVLVALLCVVLIGQRAEAAEKPPIYWLIWHLTPEFIETGDLAGQGYTDKFLKFFIANLPEYDHRIQWINVRRWSSEALKPNRCSPHIWGYFYPDKLALSKPFTFTAPQMVIFHERHKVRLGPTDTVLSLQKLLKQDDLTLVLPTLFSDAAKTQVRFPVLNKYLEPYVGKANLMQLGGLTNEANLRLLTLDRADYTLGYPTVIAAQNRVHGVGDNFVAYNIKEHNLY